MALNLTKPFNFSPSTTIASSEVDTDFDTVYNAFTGLEAGTSSMSKLPLDADPSSALYAATKQYVDVYANWRRPGLVWKSISLVDVENNTGTLNQTKIIFPDGNYRSVTEDTAVTTKYRRFDITATAQFTSGTEDSGLRSSLSEANNTWYAIYAVKSTINSANFVLVGDTTLPIQANFSTLNSNFGTNGWVYLGMIRNGDQSATAADILVFGQTGNLTLLGNTCTGNAFNALGLRVATTASAATLSYAASFGTSGAVIPNHCYNNIFTSAFNISTAIQCYVRDTGATGAYLAMIPGNSIGAVVRYTYSNNISGIATIFMNNSGGAAIAQDIFLSGFYDNVLGCGSNPIL